MEWFQHRHDERANRPGKRTQDDTTFAPLKSETAMTDLTAGCTRTGPHPAVRSEMEARAEGHTPTPYYVHRCAEDQRALGVAADRRANNGSWTGITVAVIPARCDDAETRRGNSDAAFISLACNSYDAMKAVVEEFVRRCDEVGIKDFNMKLLPQARAALSLSRGGTDKKEGA